MNEETAILLCKAGLGDLDADEQARWAELCRADPTLLRAAAEIGEVSAQLGSEVRRALDRPVREVAVPDPVRRRLEAARREVFGDGEAAPPGWTPRKAGDPSWWQRLRERVRELFESTGPLLAAAAAVAVLATGWWIWRGGDGPAPVIATLKNVAVDPDLPMVSPGQKTWLVDPPAIWMSLDPAPATVSVWSADGKVERFRSGASRPPIPWDQLNPVGDGDTVLRPGEAYLFRIERAGVRSERLVEVADGAKRLADWLPVDPEAGRKLAEDWLIQDRPADALALASALASLQNGPGESLSSLRSRALKAALAEDVVP